MTYETPRIIDYGSIAEHTFGNGKTPWSRGDDYCDGLFGTNECHS